MAKLLLSFGVPWFLSMNGMMYILPKLLEYSNDVWKPYYVLWTYIACILLTMAFSVVALNAIFERKKLERWGMRNVGIRKCSACSSTTFRCSSCNHTNYA